MELPSTQKGTFLFIPVYADLYWKVLGHTGRGMRVYGLIASTASAIRTATATIATTATTTAAATAARTAATAAITATAAANQAVKDAQAVINQSIDLAFYINENDGGLDIRVMKEGY